MLVYLDTLISRSSLKVGYKANKNSPTAEIPTVAKKTDLKL